MAIERSKYTCPFLFRFTILIESMINSVESLTFSCHQAIQANNLFLWMIWTHFNKEIQSKCIEYFFCRLFIYFCRLYFSFLLLSIICLENIAQTENDTETETETETTIFNIRMKLQKHRKRTRTKNHIFSLFVFRRQMIVDWKIEIVVCCAVEENGRPCKRVDK